MTFINRKTGEKETHLFGGSDTLKLWIASMCGKYGDYMLPSQNIFGMIEV